MDFEQEQEFVQQLKRYVTENLPLSRMEDAELEEEIEQISEDIFNIDGTSAVDEVAEMLDIEFPEGEYDTIAGYIMSVLGRIPDADEHPTVEFEGFSFTVEEMDERRIVRILAERLPEPTEDGEETAEAEN